MSSETEPEPKTNISYGFHHENSHESQFVEYVTVATRAFCPSHTDISVVTGNIDITARVALHALALLNKPNSQYEICDDVYNTSSEAEMYTVQCIRWRALYTCPALTSN